MNGSSHPELIWSGKYDDQGNLRPVERTILPFQVVETINESKADREASQRDFFTKQAQDKTWRNRLIWGDNKVVMSSLLPELAGKIDLIYIDPPFGTGQDFSFRAHVGDLEVEKLPSVIEERAYRDMWAEDTAKGIDQLSKYLGYMYERLVLMQELLSDRGSVYVHLDWQVGHHVKLLLDEVFGPGSFHSEIVWQRNTAHSNPVRYGPIHDLIYYYARRDDATWNVQHTQYADDYVRSAFTGKTEDGRVFRVNEITGSGLRGGIPGARGEAAILLQKVAIGRSPKLSKCVWVSEVQPKRCWTS